ncbi:MAG: hypothetical protein GC154_15450 [bacterium]|nr:hypothetical protein [bacterium]
MPCKPVLTYIIGLFAFTIIVSLSVRADVVINEIHYDPDLSTEWVEFIELFNDSDAAVDLSGWRIANAVDFTFPPGMSIAAHGFRVVAQDLSAVRNKYAVPTSVMAGPFQGRLANEGDKVELHDAQGKTIDEVDYQLGFPWPTTGDPIPANSSGTSHSIQLVNPSFDNDLGGSWRSAAPTPGKENSVFANNIAPQIRQVEHSPKQPKSNQPVTVTAKITDPDGVASVNLLYQIVDPGHYIKLSDAEYQSTWQTVAMHDDGSNGDLIAGDFTYTVILPPELQVHRRLMRYLITASDTHGETVKVPYDDDPQPNFAYFIYDGVPDWTGSARPGREPEVTYSGDMLSSVPVYQLISSKDEVERCTWIEHRSDNEYHYMGTLVYDGVVYDHVWFRARGGVWRYSMGKNMWKFNMNRGHYFQAKDDYGRPYATKWNKVNLGANIQQADYLHRGEQGMFESVGFRLFNMAGMEASNTNFVHFRIIDEESEVGTNNAAHPPMTDRGTQYDGDFWGLYLAVEQVDGRFLDEHGLPDGNLYKMENGWGEIRNQSPYGVTDSSDLRSFLSGYSQRPSTQFWRDQTNLDRYYNYRSIVESIHQYDIANGKNYYYYLNPETNKWFQIPWDLDLTWADNMYGQGDDPFKQAGILNNNSIDRDYQNRMREIRDLLYNPDQTNQLIYEYARFIYNPHGESFVDADRAMWDYHWVMGNQAASRGYNNPSKSGQGRFYQIAPTRDFPGMLQIMKDYVLSRGDWIDRRILDNDINVPETPVILSKSDDFSVNNLVFETSEFSPTASNSSFAAMKWRIAEVEPFSKPWDPADSGPPGFNLLISDNDRWKYFKGTQEPSEPRTAWRERDFNDSSWQAGPAPIGYGETVIRTNLDDMRGGYTTFYMRKTFTVDDLNKIGPVTAYMLYDDGFNMWINGVLVAQSNVDSDDLPYDAVAEHRENTNYVEVPLPDPSGYLVEGTNIIAIQVVNQYLSQSSDCFMDLALVAPDKEEEPEPGADPFEEILKRKDPLKYEIDPVWESEELTSFQKQIAIPADKVAAGHTYRVRVKMKDDNGVWSHWSLPVQFTAQAADTELAALQNLRVTELMYNPPGGTDYEYLELHNTSQTETIDLSGFAMTDGVSFVFPPGSTIEPDQYVLLTHAASDIDRAAFRLYYQLDNAIPIYGPITGKFDNGGEQLTLQTATLGRTVVSFEYGDGRGWPLAADGSGHTLVPLGSSIIDEPDGSLDYGRNWRTSAYIGGSPGHADPNPLQSLILNEIAANTSDDDDWVEILNPSPDAIHLGGWYLSDDKGQPDRWPLPALDLKPGESIVFDASTGFNVNGEGFAFGQNGEDALLSYLPGGGHDRVADAVSFKAQDLDETWSRAAGPGEFWGAAPPTKNRPNADALVSISIDELMYHPLDNGDAADSTSLEYIELVNSTSFPLALSTPLGPWRIDGGVEFIFPPGVTLPAGGRLLVVGFDPSDSARRHAFLDAYQLNDQTVTLEGPFTGSLSNRGERVAVEKLLGVDPADGSLAWSIVDEAIYFDRAPWPAEADGTGMALQRVSTRISANDPLNWRADAPTPGERNSNTPVSNWMVY